MPGLGDLISGALGGVGSTVQGALSTMTGGLDRQARDVQRRRLGSFIRPVDRSVIAKIQAAIGEGLDPQVGMQLLSAIGGGIDERFDAYRDRRSEQQAMAGLDPSVRQAAELAQLGVPAGVIEAQYAASAAGPTGLDPESAQAIADDTVELIAGQVPLHNARQIIIGRMRAMGSTSEEIEAAYNLIGQQYAAAPAAGPLVGGRPLNYDERLRELANQPAVERDQPSAGLDAMTRPSPSPRPYGTGDWWASYRR